VQLKHRSTGKEAEIFTLDEGELTREQRSGTPVIVLRWRDLHHLEIGYRAGKVVHQAGQIADLTVTARQDPIPR
jgi:hypothetical protein